LLAEAKEVVEVCDPDGHILAMIEPSVFSEEEIDEARKAADSREPRYTTDEVLKYLGSLEPK
jgi:hypothetical protein